MRRIAESIRRCIGIVKAGLSEARSASMSLRNGRMITLHFCLYMSIGCVVVNPEFVPKNETGPPDLVFFVSAKRRIFVTDGQYQGYLIRDPDLCQYSADAAMLTGKWRPWLSTIGTEPISAIDQIQDLGPWYDMNDRLVFLDKNNLKRSPLVPIEINQYGHFVPTGEAVWTGTGWGGAISSHVCFDEAAKMVWFSASLVSRGDIGLTGYVDARWTSFGSLPCTQRARLICIEQ